MYDVTEYPNLNRLWTGLLTEFLKNLGVNAFFTSPGLRNAPILSSIQKSTNAKVFSGVDERAMAYRALGYAKASGVPGVLVCTSGTALANYYPAIIEASKTNIPLIIISADRPKKLVEWGDNQSIDQHNLYGDYVRNFISLPEPSSSIPPQDLIDILNRGLNGQKAPGPVHINMPFDDPLDLTCDNLDSGYYLKANEVRFTQNIRQEEVEVPLPDILDGQRTLVVIGSLPEYLDKSELTALLKGANLPLLLDIGSGLKFSGLDHERVLPSFEHPEVYKLLCENPPELIIHIGGRLTSKHYYRFLRQNQKINLLLIGNENLFTHPAQSPTWEVTSKINNFCKTAIRKEYLKTLTPYTFDCKAVVGMKEDIIENSPFSFPSISKRIVELMPDDSTLYLGNSTTVRSFDAYAATKGIQKSIKVVSHRGASGIEGFNAAALGYSEESVKPTVLVHGDISFMHDLNSLLMYKGKKLPLINIIVNNHGGGIFGHLPISKDIETLPLIETKHDVQFKDYCGWLNLPYKKVDNISQLESAMGEALKAQEICIIEAIIDQENNLSVYERLKTIKL